MTAAIASLSSISLLLTCFLALCSAAVFLLLYLRPLPGPHSHARHHSSPGRRRRHSHGLKHHRPSSLSLPRSLTHTSTGHANGYSHSPTSPYSPLLLPIPIIPKPSKPATSAGSAGKKQSSAATAAHTASPTSLSSSSLHLQFRPLAAPVIVTIASTPARLPLLLPTLQSLKQQSYPIHRILVCLPPATPSTPHLPDRLTRDPLLTILRSPVEYGGIGRLIEAGRWVEGRESGGLGGGECWVMSVEDGVVYHRDMVAELVRHGVEMDGCVLGTAGYRLLGEPWVMTNVAYVRRWDERLMDEWEDELEEGAEEEDGLYGLDEEEASKSKASNGHKHRSAVHSSRKSIPRSHHTAESLLSSSNHNTAGGHSTHLHSSPLASTHSPHPATPRSPLLYPVEPCDVLSSYRAILFPPTTLPPPDTLLSHLHSLPSSSARHCDDELLCGVLSVLGVTRVCLLTPLPVVQWTVEGRRGRGGAGVTEWMAWSECMECMVRRGWWPGWEVDEREGGEGRTWNGEDGDEEGRDVHGMIEEGEVTTAGEVVESAAGGGGGQDRGEGEMTVASSDVMIGSKEREERKGNE